MRPLTGTGALIRLALRRDRIKLPLWILGVAGAMAANVPAVLDFYGGAYEKQLSYVATTAPSVISRVFGGPIHGPELGEIVMNETFLFTAVAAAFMSTLAVVRHTRQNEETGRAELIGSAVVGRQASLAAALVVTVGANVVLAALVALAFVVSDLPLAGSLAAAVALGGIGIVFAGVAAITAQVSESARGANSMAAMFIGIAFLLRGLGDGMGRLSENGLGVVSAWPSWLSPIGWGQQMYPFSDERFWTLGLLGGFFVLLTGAAFVLNARRDLGLGMIPARRGPAHAARSLLSPLGLAWRLQRGTLRGWAIGIGIMGVSLGFIADEFKELFSENEQIAEVFGQVENSVSFSDFIFGAMMALMAIVIGGYAVQALLRMRAEEATGQLEPVLANAVSRPRWMLSHVGIALAGIVLLLVLLGGTAGFTFVLITDASWSEVPKLLKAGLVHAPAVSTLAGCAILVFGLRPQWAVAVSWAGFTLCFLIAQFGQLLKLPQWLLNISPFSHTPPVPIASLSAQPLLILTAIAAILIIAGVVSFCRRDITTA